VTAKAVSRLPPPPLLRRDDERGSSASGLLLREAEEGSAEQSCEREPDTDLSSLPIEPAAMPNCANAEHGAEM